MTEEQLTHLRSIMISRIEAIEASLAEDDPESKPVAPDVAIGRLSRLESMQFQQMNLAQQRRQQEERGTFEKRPRKNRQRILWHLRLLLVAHLL